LHGMDGMDGMGRRRRIGANEADSARRAVNPGGGGVSI